MRGICQHIIYVQRTFVLGGQEPRGQGLFQFAEGARAVVVGRVLRRVFVGRHHLWGCVQILMEDSDFGSVREI